MTDIDYTKLNERIVEQAYANVTTLSREQKQKLIEDKLNRAIAHQKSLKEMFG